MSDNYLILSGWPVNIVYIVLSAGRLLGRLKHHIVIILSSYLTCIWTEGALNSKSVACYWSQVRYCELYPMVSPSLPVFIRCPVSCHLGCGTLFTCLLEQWHQEGTSSHTILCIWHTTLVCTMILSYLSTCNLSVQRCVMIYQQTRVNLLIGKLCKWYWHFLLLSTQKVGVGHISAPRSWTSSRDYVQMSTDHHDAHG